MRVVVFIVHLTVCAAFVGIIESRAVDVFLEATRPDFERIPIGVLGFQVMTGVDGSANQVEAVLKADLRRSQVFSVADLPKLGIKVNDVVDPERALFKQAAENGISVLVWGKLGLKAQEVVFDGYVYDGGDDQVVVGKRYAGPSSVVRLMVHRLADELVFRYTGEPGIAMTKIAYVSEQSGSRDIYVMDYDGYAPRQVTADGFLNLMPHWSPDRRFLAFTAYRSRTTQDIDMIELATGKRVTLVSLGGLNITPAFSPDGNYLVFTTSHDGNSELYKLDTRTKGLQRLTNNSAGDLSPAWAPTGREIAFTSDRGGAPQIYLMSGDGSNVRRLTYEGDYNAAPAWSPRGTWIAHVCRTPRKEYKLCLVSPDGQQRRQITSGPGVDDSPSWSPDGRHLVFSSTLDGKSHIYMINWDGTELERLTSGGTHHSSPSWSPLSS